MSHNELVGKFRDMLEKKKVNSKREGTPLPDFTPTLNNDKEEGSTNANSEIKAEINTNTETPNNINQEVGNKPVTKGRPTVFNLAKRFESRVENSENINQASGEKKNSMTVNSNVNANDFKFLPEKGNIVEGVNQEKESKENKDSKEIIKAANEEAEDYSAMRGRTSTNKEMVKNSLKKIFGDVVPNTNIASDINAATNSNYNSNVSANSNMSEGEKKDYDFSNNIVTQIPRKSVHQIVKMNEKRIQSGLEEKKKQGQRHSVSQKFKTNMNDIARYLQSLKEDPEERIDSEEFINKNADKLKQLGINSKDLPLVQELVSFFEKNAREKMQNEGKKRNTVATMNSYKQLNLNVQAIAEENDEEASLGDSVRLSNSQRKSNTVSERNSVGNLGYPGRGQGSRKSSHFVEKEKKVDVSSDEDSFASADSFDKHQLQMELAPDNEAEDFTSPRKEEELNANSNLNNLPNKEISLNYETKMQNKYSSFSTLTFSKDLVNGQLTIQECGMEKLKKRIEKKLDSVKVNSFQFEKLKINDENDPINYKINTASAFNIEGSKKKVTLKSEKLDITELNEISYFAPEKNKQRELNLKIVSKIANIELDKEKIKKESNKINNAQLEIVCDSQISSIKKSFMEDNQNNKESTGGLTNEFISRSKNFLNQENFQINPISPSSQLQENNFHIQNFISNHDTTARYQKNIINSLDAISVVQYNINSSIPLDPLFFDVLCINCYECVKYTEIDPHSEECVIKVDEEFEDIYSREDNEEDYNARIYKLHESLKKKQPEIQRTKDERLISIFEELVSLVYAILINNNSIEELDSSISSLNEIINHKLNTVRSNYKFTLLVFTQRISQLVYTKLQDMEKILLCVKNSGNNLLAESLEDEEVVEEENPEDEQQIKMLKMELANLEKQTMSTKVEIEQWRKESKMLENMLRRPNVNNMEVLSDIVSDVVSRRDESIDGMTMVTGQTSEYGDIANMRDINEVLDLNNEEELKKYFLSIGLSLKFKYADRITENASIADLYEKARENNIPISDWYNFICHQLKVN